MIKLLKYINLSLKKTIRYNIYKCKTFYKFNMASSEMPSTNRIIWIDLEMTGLNLADDKILEVASIITDDNLNIVSHEFEIVINQPNSILLNMNEWCKEQHKKTGLIEASQISMFDEKFAEEEIIKFLQKYVKDNTCPLAGNCLWMDTAFLKKYMPRIFDYIADDTIDVSSINELAKRWNKKIEKKKQRKTGNHRALGDIKDSIAELKYYKNKLFINEKNITIEQK